MKSFRQFTAYSEIQNIFELSRFTKLDLENISGAALTEDLIDINHALVKGGQHIKKGKNLADLLDSAGEYLSKILWYALKISQGRENLMPILKELLKRKITKEEFMSFLLKLDSLAINALKLSLRVIDSVTNWNLVDSLTDIIDNDMDWEEDMSEAAKNIYNSTDLLTASINKIIDTIRKG